jgi:hypothetical protein
MQGTIEGGRGGWKFWRDCLIQVRGWCVSALVGNSSGGMTDGDARQSERIRVQRVPWGLGRGSG